AEREQEVVVVSAAGRLRRCARSGLGAFRLGKNELEVIATKRPLPASAKACNAGSPQDVVGVVFGFAAESEADLSVSPGTAQGQYKRGSTYQFKGTFKVHNAGPSAALPGSFEFELSAAPLIGAFNQLTGSIAGTAPFGACKTDGDLTGRLKLSCPYTVFPAGTTATISFATVVKIPAEESQSAVYTLDAQWSAYSHAPGDTYGATSDPAMENNTFREQLYLCGPKATDPKCPAAPADPPARTRSQLACTRQT
ncbi:MAG: hypothetical protein M3Q31_21020, partial [Actinomycetota bacterium]|nr:hypothetical protein [Actinomycetota bacterium]